MVTIVDLIKEKEAALTAAKARYQAHVKAQTAILDGGTGEGRAELSETEQATFDDLSVQKRDEAAVIETAEAKLEDLRAEQRQDERIERAAQYVTASAGLPKREMASTQLGAEKRTYSPDNGREGISFIADVVGSISGDLGAMERLQRHREEEIVERGYLMQRDVGTGAFSGLTVPQYLTELAAGKPAAGRNLADNCRKLDLPPDGMTVEISRLTTATAAATQATQNSAVQETDADDTQLTVPVVTIAGQQDVSLQAVMRSVGSEKILVQDLGKRYHTELDRQLLHADGTSGTHLGILATTSIVAVTLTDTTPTPSEAYGALWDLQQGIESGVFRSATHFVMHPRRWAFFASAIGTNQAMVGFSGVNLQAIGQQANTVYGPGVRGELAGLPVIVDANISTTTSSTRDTIFAVTQDELFLWEQPGSPLLIRAEQTNAANLAVKLVVYGFSAFTAGRIPGAHGAISGSGLTTPVYGIAAS